MPDLDFISLFPVALGALLLIAGRKFFWLFVGAVAFFAAMSVVPKLAEVTASRAFYISLGAGALAAAAGYFLSKAAVRIAGFVAGGFVLFTLWEEFASRQPLPWWLPFLVGGILGAVLLSFLFEWALIILSSLTGAFLITQNFDVDANMQIGLLLILTAIGIAVQGKMKRGKSARQE
jgi:hypothetical protein